MSVDSVPISEQEAFRNDLNRLRGLCEDVEFQVRGLTARVSDLPKVVEFQEVNANLMLSVRHLEDAKMRLGKAIQWGCDGGKSCYNKPAVADSKPEPAADVTDAYRDKFHKVRKALCGLCSVGGSSLSEIDHMIAAIRFLQAPSDDRSAEIAALTALRETLHVVIEPEVTP